MSNNAVATTNNLSTVSDPRSMIDGIVLWLVSEFRDVLEIFERVSSSIAKIELQELMLDAEKNLNERKRQFDIDLNETLDQSNDEKTSNYEHLRPTLGQPARKHDLEQIDTREKHRQEDISKKIHNLRTDAIVIFANELERDRCFACSRKICRQTLNQQWIHLPPVLNSYSFCSMKF